MMELLFKADGQSILTIGKELLHQTSLEASCSR